VSKYRKCQLPDEPVDEFILEAQMCDKNLYGANSWTRRVDRDEHRRQPHILGGVFATSKQEANHPVQNAQSPPIGNRCVLPQTDQRRSVGVLVGRRRRVRRVDSLFRIENNAEGVDFVTVATVRDSHSHCACVTGVFISGDYFLTTSVDQKLLVFKWRVDEDKLFVEAVDRYNSAVADVQGLGCDEEDDCFNVFLYGKGVEYVRCVKSIT
jgi:hypothetical protein